MTEPKLSALKTMVMEGVKNVIASDQFSEWLRQQNTKDGDLVVINNSFIYRKPLIKTSKNRHYLCVEVKGKAPHHDNIVVAAPDDFNSDFKLLRASSTNLPSLDPIDKALQAEMKRLGHLLFVLIGELEDIPAEVSLNHRYAKTLRFDPSANREGMIEKARNGEKKVVVKQLLDPEPAWSAIEPEIKPEIGNDLSKFETAFGAAFETLQDEARSRLTLPKPSATRTTTSFIVRLNESVIHQRKTLRTSSKEVCWQWCHRCCAS